jgi:hypothetical protein
MSNYANINEGTTPTNNPNATYIPQSQTENNSPIIAVLGGAGAVLSAVTLILFNFRKARIVN